MAEFVRLRAGKSRANSNCPPLFPILRLLGRRSSQRELFGVASRRLVDARPAICSPGWQDHPLDSNDAHWGVQLLPGNLKIVPDQLGHPARGRLGQQESAETQAELQANGSISRLN